MGTAACDVQGGSYGAAAIQHCVLPGVFAAIGQRINDDRLRVIQRDGVIVLRGVFRDWIAPLRDGFEQVLAAPGPFAIENVGNNERGRFFEDYCNWQRIEPFSRFIHQSPAAALAGQLMGARQVQIFHEHILVKEPGTAKATPRQQLTYFDSLDYSRLE